MSDRELARVAREIMQSPDDLELRVNYWHAMRRAGLPPANIPENQQGNIPDDLDDYDWRRACEGSSLEYTDIRFIYAYFVGENDYAPWLLLAELWNGKFVTLAAGCDYTGWDCRSWGESNVFDNIRDAVFLGFDAAQRRTLFQRETTA